ncbi:MAG TPA: bacteriophage Gp15 family protein [Candidatus Mediterraneibacter excrementigallinarum]|nr:bacteriophage Gp15 family protein [Candidatus Mediterraneibacter excrementigallinarum]
MSFLTDPIKEEVVFGRRKYLIYAPFNRVLEVQRLFREDELPDLVKIQQALKMLTLNSRKTMKLSPKDMQELLQEIFEKCINTQKRPDVKSGKPPVLDFDHDAEYIYASFMLDYGIDLIDMQGKLHWKKFISLFHGLSEQTKIREVMRIRSMEVPRFTGKNGKAIQEIQELKSYYALPIKGGGGQEGLDALFSTLERMAVKNG